MELDGGDGLTGPTLARWISSLLSPSWLSHLTLRGVSREIGLSGGHGVQQRGSGTDGLAELDLEEAERGACWCRSGCRDL